MKAVSQQVQPKLITTSKKLGEKVRGIRKARRWTLKDVAERTGLAISTLSKMERGDMSLTYDRFMRLAEGLDLDVGDLFDSAPTGMAYGAVEVTRKGTAPALDTQTYTYEMLASGLADKKMVPMLGTIQAHSFLEFEDYISHPGEEFIYVLDGTVMVHMKGRSPLELTQGDSLYFDSGLGHAFVATAQAPAKILAVCCGG